MSASILSGAGGTTWSLASRTISSGFQFIVACTGSAEMSISADVACFNAAARSDRRRYRRQRIDPIGRLQRLRQFHCFGRKQFFCHLIVLTGSGGRGLRPHSGKWCARRHCRCLGFVATHQPRFGCGGSRLVPIRHRARSLRSVVRKQDMRGVLLRHCPMPFRRDNPTRPMQLRQRAGRF